MAELAPKYLYSDSLIYLEGRLKTRSWEDREGIRRMITEWVGDNLIIFDQYVEASPGLPTLPPGGFEIYNSDFTGPLLEPLLKS